jgi:hypothetical protein
VLVAASGTSVEPVGTFELITRLALELAFSRPGAKRICTRQVSAGVRISSVQRSELSRKSPAEGSSAPL